MYFPILSLPGFHSFQKYEQGLVNKSLQPVFSHWSYKVFLDKGGTDEIGKRLLSIVDSDGRSVFTDWDMINFLKVEGDVSYARNFVDSTGVCNVSGYEIYRHKQLGIGDFVDTDVLNAVFLMPGSDHNGVFESRKMLQFHVAVDSVYDLDTRVWHDETELYDALDTDAKLVIIGAHSLFSSMNPMKGKPGENNRLDLYDTELEQYISKLPSDAVIFLLGCETAKDTTVVYKQMYPIIFDPPEDDNLAQMVSRYAGRRRVIAAKEGVSAYHFNVTNWYPFDIQLIKEGRDITYKTGF